jgi:serine/threonine-protein kinase
MPNDSIDLAFARHVRMIGLVTQEQVNTALETQAESLKEGKTLSFSEVLVQMGIITSGQRETLEKRVRDQQAGIQQLGDFKLLRKIGEGGMGAVYLAQDPAGKSVAVKVLPRQLGTNAEFVKRFRREAEAATKLKHPNIIGAFSTGEDLGYHYYVMEYCDGMPVDKLLLAQKSLPVAQALSIALEVARGLKYAHDLGIIHRDIKPSNIILSRDGQAKVLDLGLSKDLADSALSFKTMTGAVLGTPHYISPEQAQGDKSVDGRSDIYSLGATLYHLLTGKTPFDGESALEILSKHVNTVLPNPQDVKDGIPDPVVHVLERMMAKAPSDRYRDCGELIPELIDASQGRTPKSEGIAPQLTTIAPSVRRAGLKKRAMATRRATAPSSSKNLVLIGGGVAAALVVLLVVTMSGRSQPGPESPSPSSTGPRVGVARGPEPVKGGFDVGTWEKSVADLPPEARVKSVQARLKILNPGYDGTESEHVINHGRVFRLHLGHASLRDISPLRALPELRELELTRTQVADLSPLQDSKLTLLLLDDGKVSDLGPLRTMKDLGILSLTGLPLKTLAGLEGMDLTRLTVKNCPVSDLTPLKRVRLRELNCDFDAKRDTDVLKSMPALEQINGMPVEEFWRKLRGSEPAAGGDPASTPQDSFSPVLAALKRLNPEWGGRETHTIENGAVTELVIVALGMHDLTPLSTLTSLQKLTASGYWSTSERKEYRSPLKDLAPLRGLPLRELSVHHSMVTDLRPLQGMPLENLDVGSTNVKDLSPLKGMSLKTLGIGFTEVRSLAPIAGMPLTNLSMQKLDPVDLSILQGLPLRLLEADLDPQKHGPMISSIKTLDSLNGGRVWDFIKSTMSEPSSTPAEAALWKHALELLPQIDPGRDTVSGPWRKDGARLFCDGGESAVLRIPYEPPAEYDFRVVFLRESGTCATIQFLCKDGRNFAFDLGGYGNALSGFATVGGRGTPNNPTKIAHSLHDGQRYNSVVEVRRDRVTAFLDGKKWTEWLPQMGELGTDPGWCVDIPGLIGLGNCESRTYFESIQIREVTGRGRLRTATTTPPDAAFLKTVASQSPAEQVRRVVEKLRELNLGYDAGSIRHKIEGDKVAEFSCPAAKLTDAWPLRAFSSLRKLEIGDERSAGALADIAFLKGMKLSELCLFNTRVTDLSPLQGMPLARLQLTGSGVKDLSSLRGSKITWLSIAGTAVLDLAPLKDVPIQKLDCDRSLTTDFSALKAIRTLKTVNDLPVAEFMKSVKEAWSPLFDGRSTDFLRSPLGWKLDHNTLVSDGTGLNSAQSRFEFENGDLRIRFEENGCDSISFRVRQSEKGANGVFFDGAASRPLEGRPHELIFTCRGEFVAATLDGRPMSLHDTQPSRSGCLQFNAAGGSLRVLSVEYRPAP